MRRFALFGGLLGCLFLAGCAALSPPPPAPAPGNDAFALEARFALRVAGPPAHSSGGRLSWQHALGEDRVLLANPLGVGLAELGFAPGRAWLRGADGRTAEAADPAELIEGLTGQRLPLARLPDWLRGRSAGGSRRLDASGRVDQLDEAGWQVDYAYPDDAPASRPQRLTLRRGDEIELRLRIESWREEP